MEIGKNISAEQAAIKLLAAESQLLQMICSRATLAEILLKIALTLETLSEDVIVSILLVEAGKILHGAAPHLPHAYNAAINGQSIGPAAGSCGTAAYRGEPVIVNDIENDPLWEKYRDIAREHNLRACWSTPIKSREGIVVATFAMYYHEPRFPEKKDFEFIEHATHITQIAIERKTEEETLQKSESRFRSLIEGAGDGIFFSNIDGFYKDVNSSGCAMLGYSRDEILSMNVTDVIVPEEKPRVTPELQEVAAGNAYLREWTFLRKDGTTFPGEVHGRSLSDGSIVGILRDLTERRRIQETLAASENKLREMRLDLELARRIHSRTLPAKLPELIKAKINVNYLPLRAVGGDFYDFAERDSQHVGILIADVMGHGLAAALDASSVRIAFKDALAKSREPSEIIGSMNTFLFPYLDYRLVSAVYAEIDTAQMVLRACFAGHPPLLLARCENNEIIEIGSESMLMGISQDYKYQVVEQKLHDNDVIFFFTDGIYENFTDTESNTDWLQFRNSLRKHASSDQREADEAVLAEMNQRPNYVQVDDITFLSVRIGSGSSESR